MLLDSLGGYISYGATKSSTGSYPRWTSWDTRDATKDWPGCPSNGWRVFDSLLSKVGQTHVFVAASIRWFSTSFLLLIDDVMDVIDHLLSRLIPKVYLVAIRQSDDRHLRVLYCWGYCF
jgi:hypothetical protein